MRAVFNVDVLSESSAESSADSKKYPSAEKVGGWLRHAGYEAPEIGDLGLEPKEALAEYKKQSHEIFASMIEHVEDDERETVIFYGVIADSSRKSKFVVTRPSEGQITFRIFQERLSVLLRAVERIVTGILHKKTGGGQLALGSRSKIEVLENNEQEVITVGEVVPSAWRKAIERSKKDTLLVAIAGVLAFGLYFYLVGPGALLSSAEAGNLDRIDSGLFAATIVAGVSLSSVWFELRGNMVVDWKLFKHEN